MEMIVDKKEIGTVFLFEFKMDHKAAETMWNINNIFGLGTASECTVQRWFKKLCKGDENLEDEKRISQPLEVDNDPLRTSLKLILLKLCKKFPKNSVSISIWLFGTWNKLETWESSISEWLISWPQMKKNFLKCHLPVFYATRNHFSIGLWHETKSGF